MAQRKTKSFTVNCKLINVCSKGKLLILRLQYNGHAINAKNKGNITVKTKKI